MIYNHIAALVGDTHISGLRPHYAHILTSYTSSCNQLYKTAPHYSVPRLASPRRHPAFAFRSSSPSHKLRHALRQYHTPRPEWHGNKQNSQVRPLVHHPVLSAPHATNPTLQSRPAFPPEDLFKYQDGVPAADFLDSGAVSYPSARMHPPSTSLSRPF